MFLFPSFTSDEIPIEDLRVYLSHCSVPADSHAAVLRPKAGGELIVNGQRYLATLRELSVAEGGTEGWLVAVVRSVPTGRIGAGGQPASGSVSPSSSAGGRE